MPLELLKTFALFKEILFSSTDRPPRVEVVALPVETLFICVAVFVIGVEVVLLK